MPEPTPETLKMQLARALAVGTTISRWCKENNVTRAIASGWSRLTRIQELVEGLRTQLVDRAIGAMVDHLGTAVATIVQVIATGDTGPLKLAAAGRLIDNLLKVQDQAEVKASIREIKQRLTAEENRRARAFGQSPIGRPELE